jgi:large subunit ribosomal protein L35
MGGWSFIMPKMKTISGAKKRFRKTASGVKRKKAFHRHNIGKNSGKKGQSLRQTAMVHDSDLAQVKRMLLM